MNGLPLYLTDPDAYRAGLARGNETQPRKRACADALITDEAGRVLLVDPAYKPRYDLPGGMCDANESPHATVTREVREELGIDLTLGMLLVVDWVPAHGQWDDMLAFVWEGGRLAHSVPVRLMDDELSGFGWYTAEMAQRMLSARMWRRLGAALKAAEKGVTMYLQDGYPASSLE